MKLLADECLEPAVVQALKDFGHDVLWMRDAFSGTLDPAVAEIAAEQDRIILSYDVAFAAEMRLSNRDHPGFIIARLAGFPKAEIAGQFEQVLRMKPNWHGIIAVIKPTGVRFHP
jgi:predicted nuclease of predicted toxin-antitoxin system